MSELTREEEDILSNILTEECSKFLRNLLETYKNNKIMEKVSQMNFFNNLVASILSNIIVNNCKSEKIEERLNLLTIVMLSITTMAKLNIELISSHNSTIQ